MSIVKNNVCNRCSVILERYDAYTARCDRPLALPSMICRINIKTQINNLSQTSFYAFPFHAFLALKLNTSSFTSFFNEPQQAHRFLTGGAGASQLTQN